MSRVMKRKMPSMTVEELLAQSPWFEGIGAEARAEVRRSILECHVPAGQLLSHQGEMQHHWVGVLEGLLTWSLVTIDGQAVSFSGQAPGSWFGEGTLLRGQPRRSDLIALRSTRAALLPRDTFEWLRQTERSFTDFLLIQINERLHWFMGNFAAYGLLDADRLVARALIGLVHPLLNPLGNRYLQVTQEELARLAAVSRSRCNETLVAMQHKGMVKLDYGAVTVIDLPGLVRLSEA